MTKKLNTSSIINELRGASPFFPAAHEQTRQEADRSPLQEPQKEVTEREKHDPAKERYHDTMTPRNHDTMVSAQEQDMLEIVRKAVRQVGKEAATQRLTLEEKQALADIEYRYQRQGIRTSGNEIARIAINYVIEDYRKNGENSILAQALHKLNS
jgi:hypothetical protein